MRSREYTFQSQRDPELVIRDLLDFYHDAQLKNGDIISNFSIEAEH
jgi:hypothetical protein